MILVTTHRRENLGDPMHHVYRALRRLVEAVPDTEVVFPVHRNPLVREAVSEELEGVPGIHLVEPMEYEPFTNLMARSAIVLTDSGGIQEEAPQPWQTGAGAPGYHRASGSGGSRHCPLGRHR